MQVINSKSKGTKTLGEIENNPTIIDLFCGAGGLSLGFEQAGFQVLYANDIDRHSITTYKKNRPYVDPNHIVCDDIQNFIKKLSQSTYKCDLVIGGPPCQGFSMANRQRPIDDPRNELYKKFVEVIDMVKPRVFVMENVKGMLGIADQVVDDFRQIGYESKFSVINAKRFGIPQNRERLFYIGLRNDQFDNTKELLESIFSEIKGKEQSTTTPLINAFWGLRSLQARTKKNTTNDDSIEHGYTIDVAIEKNKIDCAYVQKINEGRLPSTIYNHKARYNNARDIKIYTLLPPGGKSNHPTIADIMPYNNRKDIFIDKFCKLRPDAPSKTITSHMKFDCHMYIHPSEARGLTPREAARIQSFPDNYIFCGPFTQWYHQIGNSVPPLLAQMIATSVKNIVFK